MGKDEEPPDRGERSGGWTEGEWKLGVQLRRLSPRGLPEPAGRFCRGATRSKLRMAIDIERYRER